MLVGNYEATLDGKGRLSIVSQFRRELPAVPADDAPEGSPPVYKFVLVPGRRPRTLILWPEQDFRKQRAAEVPNERLTDEAYEWRQFEYSQMTLVETDGSGRVTLPSAMIEFAGLSREVSLVGAKEYIEIWRKDDYADFCRRMRDSQTQMRQKAAAEQRAAEQSGLARHA